MRLYKIFLIVILLLGLYGCKEQERPMPKCLSFDVYKSLEDVLQNNNIIMESNNDVTTIKTENNLRMCQSRVVTNTGESFYIDYKITLSDDSQTFMLEATW